MAHYRDPPLNPAAEGQTNRAKKHKNIILGAIVMTRFGVVAETGWRWTRKNNGALQLQSHSNRISFYSYIEGVLYRAIGHFFQELMRRGTLILRYSSNKLEHVQGC